MARKHICPEFENHERWLVSFADMMTLLFAVFVVLFALKKGSKDDTITQASASIAEEFSMQLEEIPVNRRFGPKEKGIGIFRNFGGDREVDPSEQVIPKEKADFFKLLDNDKKIIEDFMANRLYGPEKHRKSVKPGEQRLISVYREVDGLRVRVLGSHFYDPGSYKIRRSALVNLDALGEILRSLDKPFTVEGHTDSTKPSGPFDNWEISSLRASFIVRHFINNLGISPSMVKPAGYGDAKPITTNETKEGRALNRRIDIKIHYEDP